MVERSYLEQLKKGMDTQFVQEGVDLLHLRSEFTGLPALKNRSLTLESSNRQLFRYTNLLSKITGDIVQGGEK